MSENNTQNINPVWLALGGSETGSIPQEVFEVLQESGSFLKVGEKSDGGAEVFKDNFGKSYVVYTTKIPVNIKDKKNPNSYKLLAITDEEAKKILTQ